MGAGELAGSSTANQVLAGRCSHSWRTIMLKDSRRGVADSGYNDKGAAWADRVARSLELAVRVLPRQTRLGTLHNGSHVSCVRACCSFLLLRFCGFLGNAYSSYPWRNRKSATHIRPGATGKQAPKAGSSCSVTRVCRRLRFAVQPALGSFTTFVLL